MAITENEINISNKSYINKDFGSVYPELLELCQKLTNRWVPDSSNESDPGIVLLKLAAFVADKLNYNIDKNILECFMPSATQESSMRNLCEMNGYTMKYYNSAITNISFIYNAPLDGSFTLPKYSTVVSTEDGSVSYTLLENCVVYAEGVITTAKAIQGTLETLQVGGVNTIQLSNIDDENRLYLPTAMVAQNGVIISDANGANVWEATNNLHAVELNSRVFKVNYDSNKQLPYIEFPEDIANLIGEGLLVRYIITQGAAGNVSAKAINTLKSPDSVVISGTDEIINNLSDVLSVSNPAATNDGTNPETIEEAYSNFKKTVGTFNTLVTCRDYANFIYNLVDPITLKYIVSNIQVADRRDDYNYSNNIVTYNDQYGQYVTAAERTDKSITPYELCLYPLSPITTSYTLETYNKSFTPAPASLITSDAAFKDAKCMAHNIKEFDKSTDVFCFKNKYTLDIQIATYDKIDSIQQELLVENVKTALYENFNSRQVNFGDALILKEVKAVIEASDSRISDVNLTEVKLEPYVVSPEGTEVKLADNETVKDDIIVKNVLAGNISLFQYNEDYQIKYGQKVVPVSSESGSAGTIDKYQTNNGISPSVLSKIKTIEPKLTIPKELLKDGKSYIIQDNEMVQLVAPNFTSETSYGVYVNYRFESAEDTVIKANEIYTLKSTDTLKFVYTDSETNIQHNIIYTATEINRDGNIEQRPNGVTVKSTFEIMPFTEDVLANNSIAYRLIDNIKYRIIGTNETIESLVKVQTVLNEPVLPCYWIMNNPTNRLFDQDEAVGPDDNKIVTKILRNGEYFMYSNKALTELVILGSGTKLTLTNAQNAFTNGSWDINEHALDIDDINSNGLGAFSDANWQNRQLAATPIIVEELNIVTLNSGDSISCTVDTELNSTFKQVQDINILNADGTINKIPTYSDSANSWQARALLNINAGPNKEQVLREHQQMTFTDSSSNKFVITGGSSTPPVITFNYNTVFTGVDGAVNVAKRTISGVSLELKNGIETTVYQTNKIVYPSPSSYEFAGLEIQKDASNKYRLSLAGFGSAIKTDAKNDTAIKISMLPITKDRYFSIYYVEDIKLKLSATGAKVKNYATDEELSADTPISNGLTIIKVEKNSADDISTIEMSIDYESTTIKNGTVWMEELKLVDGLNTNFGDNVSESRIKTKIQSMDKNHIFYYLAKIDKEKDIEFSQGDNLMTASSFWDKNNIVNKFTIPQIDFETSTIYVAKSSQK